MSTLEPSRVQAVAAIADGDWQMSVATGRDHFGARAEQVRGEAAEVRV